MVDIVGEFKKAIQNSPYPEAELARRFGTSPQNMHQRFITGRFTSDEINRLAKALGYEASFKLKKAK